MIHLKKLTLTLVALFAMTTGAWAQGPVDGTIAWSVGNEASATVSASIKDAISSTGVTTGSGLTVESATYLATDMVKYTPTTANAGNVSGVMIEYRIETANGYKFKPTGVDYAAVKVGNDNISYSWSYTIDGAESAITDVSKDDVLRSNGNNSGTAQLMHSESITADGCSVFTLRFYISNCGTTKNICIGNITISGSVSAAASPASGPEVAWNKAEKTGTFTMPAGNVELQVAYFPGMLTLAQTAQGSIEVVGLSGETLPAGFDTDGTNYYVEPKTQFQVKAVPAEGYHLVSLSDGTNTYDVDANGIATVTMPEGDADLTLTATFSDEFELTFDDVNYKTNANITVKVGDADKTLDQDGKLSVKSGQTVTLTAKQGYKFRSVEAKKAAKAPTTAQLNAPSSWNGDNTKVTANDLPGLVALTDEEAQAIVCPDAEGEVYVIHDIPSDGYIKIIAFINGEKQAQQSFTLGRTHGGIYYDVNDNDIQIKYYYTTGK